jgi:fumarate hydratase subunit beta
MIKKLNLPLDEEDLRSLRAGDQVLLSGIIYTARDAAHKRMFEAISQGLSLPISMEGQAIYYVGPCPASPGQVIGSAGPTTSGRMDAYAPSLIGRGLKVMIGKGSRSAEVIKAMNKHGAVYLVAIGGVGALLSKCIVEAEVVAYPELGPEAIQRLKVEQFPAVVAIDTLGNDWYQIGKDKYRRKPVAG